MAAATGAALSARDPFGQRSASRGVGEIGLGHDDAVGQRHLLPRLGHPVEIARAVDRIDDRDQRLQMKFAAERPVAGKGLQHRPGIGEAGGFDHDPLESSAPRRAPGRRTSVRRVSCRSVRTVQHTQPLPSSTVTSLLDRKQRVVDADLAVFVDDDRGVGALGLAEQGADQRRLARAEKPGHRDDRQRGPRARR